LREVHRLPPGFVDLEELVAEGWCLETWVERNDRRHRSTMEELGAFYDQVMLRADDILQFLDKVALETMESQERRLLQLMLMLTEVSFPIERHGDPCTPNAVDTKRFKQWDPTQPGLVP